METFGIPTCMKPASKMQIKDKQRLFGRVHKTSLEWKNDAPYRWLIVSLY